MFVCKSEKEREGGVPEGVREKESSVGMENLQKKCVCVT